MSSRAEWLALFLREAVTPDEFAIRLNPNLPDGLTVLAADPLPQGRKVAQPVLESFALTVPGDLAGSCLAAWRAVEDAAELPVVWDSKKGPRRLDAKSLVAAVATDAATATVRFTCRFDTAYVSPLRLVEAVCPELVRGGYELIKAGVVLADGGTFGVLYSG